MRRANSLENTLILGKLKAGGERDDRGRDGCIASLTRWTWAWASSGKWWRTGKPAVLQSMGLQRVGHDWATEQQQQSLKWKADLPPGLNLEMKSWTQLFSNPQNSAASPAAELEASYLQLDLWALGTPFHLPGRTSLPYLTWTRCLWGAHRSPWDSNYVQSWSVEPVIYTSKWNSSGSWEDKFGKIRAL